MDTESEGREGLSSSQDSGLADWELAVLFIDRKNSREEVDLGMVFRCWG